MSIIKVSCIDQTLAFENTPRIASGGSGEDFLQFTFCSAWDGFTKTVSFWKKGSIVYGKDLSDDNICEIPADLTKGEGIIYFGVYGSHEDGRRRTSEVLTYQIVQGAIAPGEIVPGGDIILTVLQSKTVTPTGKQFVVLPDAGYTGLSDVTVEGDGNLKPWNILKGITIYGVTGTAEIDAEPGSADWPFPDADDTDPSAPPSEDAMDEAAQEDDPDVNTEDKMVLVDNNGNITTGYLYTEPDSGLMVYNGTVLPELPEWDKEAYPYAYVYVLVSGMYHFRVQSEPNSYNGTAMNRPQCNYIDYLISGEQWGTPTTGSSEAGTFAGLITWKWTNTDILNKDGTVYLKASTPTEYDGFQITWYDPATTNFKAVGWRRVSKHTTGENAGKITRDDFTRQESGGWNYLRNIRSCTREKLYYKGVEVWPTDAYKDSRWNYGEGTLQSLGALPPTIAQYPYAIIRYTGMIIHELFMSTVPFTVVTEGTGLSARTYLRSTQAGSAIYYIENDGAQNTDEFWVRDTSKNKTFEPDENVYQLTLGYSTGWANYEVYNEEGTAVYDTPEPVPATT